MDIFGCGSNRRKSSNSSDIGISIQSGGKSKHVKVNISVRKPEIIELESVKLGFDGSRLYFLKSIEEDAFTVGANATRYYIRTSNDQVISRLKDCEGYYNAYFDAQRKAWYVNLRHKDGSEIQF